MHETLVVAVGSTSETKTGAARLAFSKAFPEADIVILSASTQSGVPDQPTDLATTAVGAQNRAMHLRDLCPHAHYWVGVEGGCTLPAADGSFQGFACSFIIRRDGATAKGVTDLLDLPREVGLVVREGLTIADGNRRHFGPDWPHLMEEPIYSATGGQETRTTFHAVSVARALEPLPIV